MNEKVTESRIDPHGPKPSREERDAAYSAGAGRRAEEEDVRKSPPKAPIGTELETKGEEKLHR